MVIAYINNNISLSQIPELFPNSQYEGMAIEKEYVLEKFEKAENGKTIFPRIEDDAEEQLINDAQPGDIVITSTLVNFSAQITGAMRVIRLLNEKNVRIMTHFEKFDSCSEQGKAFIDCFPLIQNYERNVKKERFVKHHNGIERAKKEGKFDNQGRKPIKADSLEGFDNYYSAYIDNELSKSEFARRLGISRPTLDKLIQQQKLKKGGA